MALLQTIAQAVRRLYVLYWRTTRRLYWNAYPHTRIPSNARIATTCKFELETGGSVQLGSGCQLTHYSIIAPYGGRVELADRVYVGHHTVIYGHGGVTIGQDTMLAANVVVVAMSHGFADLITPIARQPYTAKGIKIGRDCWIGAGVTILDGVQIGDGCVVGAGAVVNRSLPAHSIAVGAPARIIRQRAAA